jgi:hypothetical protein
MSLSLSQPDWFGSKGPPDRTAGKGQAPEESVACLFSRKAN